MAISSEGVESRALNYFLMSGYIYLVINSRIKVSDIDRVGSAEKTMSLHSLINDNVKVLIAVCQQEQMALHLLILYLL